MNRHFIAALRTHFEATGKELNFCNQYAACQTINSDVYLATGGCVQNVVKADDINQFTDIILVSAFFFRGRWTRKHRNDVPFYVKNSQFKIASTPHSTIQSKCVPRADHQIESIAELYFLLFSHDSLSVQSPQVSLLLRCRVAYQIDSSRLRPNLRL